MGRWQPDARERLQLAALALYGERGYEETTVAEIAERAGLTKRTFFRYFADSALLRAERGEKWLAMKAIFTAVRIFPLRSMKHLMSDTPLRRALLICLMWGTAAARMHHLPLWLYLAHC